MYISGIQSATRTKSSGAGIDSVTSAGSEPSSGSASAPSPDAAAPRRPAVQAADTTPSGDLAFEDKLKQFMSVSDSKQSELNRYMSGKRGGGRRRK